VDASPAAVSDIAAVWQRADVVQRFLDERSLLIPHREEQVAIMLRVVGAFRPQGVTRVLDLGCGSGVLLAAILGAFPEACGVGLDYSPPMLAAAAEKLESLRDRVALVPADLADPGWLEVVEGPFDAVVSGYCIHHLPDERKRALYREVYDLLGPGGVFLNAEHVASPTPEIETLFEDAMAAHLHRRRRERGEQVSLEAVRRDFTTRADRAANILAPLEDQLAWLRETGFEQVDCFWKWFELAIFGGVKREA
jgi:tRNA (cmo5U34)-methyltransferase